MDDRMDDNAKVVEAGPVVRDLHAQAIRYCSRELTDGRVPAVILKRIAREISGQIAEIYGCTIEARKMIAAGLAGGLFEEDELGYVVHDYLDWNSSRSQVIGDQGQRQAAGRVGGLRSAETRRARYGTAQPARPEAPPEATASEAPEATPKRPPKPSRSLTQNPERISVVPSGTTSSPAEPDDRPRAVPVRLMVATWNAHCGSLPKLRPPVSSARDKMLRATWALILAKLREAGLEDSPLEVFSRSTDAFAGWEYSREHHPEIDTMIRDAHRDKWVNRGLQPRAAERQPYRDPSIDALVAGMRG